MLLVRFRWLWLDKLILNERCFFVLSFSWSGSVCVFLAQKIYFWFRMTCFKIWWSIFKCLSLKREVEWESVDDVVKCKDQRKCKQWRRVVFKWYASYVVIVIESWDRVLVVESRVVCADELQVLQVPFCILSHEQLALVYKSIVVSCIFVIISYI